MVGRTPEYLGKKIEIFEMKMPALVILIPPVLVLLGTALAVIVPAGKTAAWPPVTRPFTCPPPGRTAFTAILKCYSRTRKKLLSSES
jgi:hypothetical protein